jgi:hypothetical protein
LENSQLLPYSKSILVLFILFAYSLIQASSETQLDSIWHSSPDSMMPYIAKAKKEWDKYIAEFSAPLPTYG